MVPMATAWTDRYASELEVARTGGVFDEQLALLGNPTKVCGSVADDRVGDEASDDTVQIALHHPLGRLGGTARVYAGTELHELAPTGGARYRVVLPGREHQLIVISQDLGHLRDYGR